MEPVRTRVLLIEDNADDALLFEETVAEVDGEEVVVEHVAEMNAGLKVLRSDTVDVVVLDLGLPDTSTAAAVQTLVRDNPTMPVAVLTGIDDPDLRSLAFEQGAREYFRKRDLSPSMVRRVLGLSITRERQLTEMASWSALGRLAAGVAHEINNPMSYVMLNLNLLRGDIERLRESQSQLREEAFGDMAELVEECLDGARRVTSIVKDLSLFGAVRASELAEVDFEEVTKGALRMVRQEIEMRAQLHVELESVPSIVGDRPRLIQVVSNLLMNAYQAVEATEREEHHIWLKLVRKDEHLVLTVTDTGHGIPEDLTHRMFEPFFTTRLGSGGTGLGLSISRATVERHGGRLEASGGPEGARFEVELPIESHLHLPVPEVPDLSDRPRRNILLIESEPRLRAALERHLERDYEVQAVNDVSSALAAVRASDFPFDLILCDMQMPKLDGEAFYEALAEEAPEHLKVLVFMTGGVFLPKLREFASRVDRPILQKPLDLESVDQLLGRRAPDA